MGLNLNRNRSVATLQRLQKERKEKCPNCGSQKLEIPPLCDTCSDELRDCRQPAQAIRIREKIQRANEYEEKESAKIELKKEEENKALERKRAKEEQKRIKEERKERERDLQRV